MSGATVACFGPSDNNPEFSKLYIHILAGCNSFQLAGSFADYERFLGMVCETEFVGRSFWKAAWVMCMGTNGPYLSGVCGVTF